MKRQSIIVLAMVFLSAASDVSKADLMGYVATYSPNSVLHSINLDTGDLTLIGETGIPLLLTFEVSPIDGTLYAVNSSGDFYRIDTSTSIGTLIKSNICSAGGSLACAPDGTLYGIAEYSDGLFVIDPNTGNVTSIGSLSPYIYTVALAIDSYGKAIGWDAIAQWLFEIDLTDGSPTSIGYLNKQFDALDYGPDGELYGWTYGDLYSIDANNLEAIQLWDFTVGGYPFTIILKPPPHSDECADADSIEKGIVYTGSTEDATGNNVSSCGNNDTNDVWFSYTATEDGYQIFSLCGSNFDTTLSIFDECEGTELACDDNACGLQSKIVLNLTVDYTYLIRIAGNNGETGDYLFSVKSPECLAEIKGDLNDDCKVDSRDFALLANSWLECNLDPPEACW